MSEYIKKNAKIQTNFEKLYKWSRLVQISSFFVLTTNQTEISCMNTKLVRNLYVYCKLMRFNQVKSTDPTLIVIELAFNRHLQFDSSSPIYRRDDFDSRSRSEFESKFEYISKTVNLYQK